MHPKFPKARGLCLWGILLLLLPIAWTALPSSDYSAPSATSVGHWCFEERLPFLYFPSTLSFLWTLPVSSQVGLRRNALGGVFLIAPSALCGSPGFTQGRSGLPVPPNNALLVHHYGSYFHGSSMVSVLLADISSKVCQGGCSPKGYSRFLRITIALLSQAPRLGSLLLPHGAFQGTFLTARDGPRR